MKLRLLWLSLFAAVFLLSTAASAKEGEHIFLSGGPALREGEVLRKKSDQHDIFWAAPPQTPLDRRLAPWERWG